MASIIGVIKNRREVVQLLAKVLKQDEIEYKNTFYYNVQWLISFL